MKKIIDEPCFLEIRSICDLMYKKGWNERNGGNITYLLKEEEIKKYVDLDSKKRKYDLESAIPSLGGKLFLVSGTGKYFKNVLEHPEENLGIIKISNDGKHYYILWGLPNSKPTSEISAHLLCHASRLKKDPEHRAIIHTHATNVEAMTFVEKLTDRDFTRTLWKMQTESLVVFPEGIGVLPWMVCGSDLIGKATAEKMKDYRTVIWAHHGIICAGKGLEETFGLIETIEKAAEIYMKISNQKIKQTITDEQLKQLAKAFNVDYNRKML